MRRLIVVIALLAGILGTCLYTLYRVRSIHDEVEHYVNAVFLSIEREDSGAVGSDIAALTALWRERERELVKYVRHYHVDDINLCIARLEPLARHGSYDSLSAELSVIRGVMTHIRDGEQASLRNVF